MADEKVTVAYIGPKKEKTYTDPETRIDHVFPQFEKVDVSAGLAHRILRHKDVFVKGEELAKREKDAKATQKEQEKELAKQRELAALEEAARQNTVLIGLDQKVVDLNKYTMAKLKTLVEAESLNVPHNGEGVDAYRAAVKAALVNKYPEHNLTAAQALSFIPTDAVDSADAEPAKESQEEGDKPESGKEEEAKK